MARETHHKMTLEEAVKILEGDFLGYSLAEIEEAQRIVKENNPDHTCLKSYAVRKENFEREQNLTEDDVSVYEENSQTLDDFAEGYKFEDFLAEDNAEINNFINRAEIYSGSGKKKTVLDEKAKNSYLELLFEGAKLKTGTYLTGDKAFSEAKTKTEKENVYKDEIKNTFFADFAQCAVSSSLDLPTKTEQRIGSPEYKSFILRQAQKATKLLNNVIDGHEKISIKTNSILSSCADTAVKVENYIRGLRQKVKYSVKDTARKFQAGTKEAAQAVEDAATSRYNQLANKIQHKKNQFEILANHVSENGYAIWKNIKGSFNDNKIKLGSNIAANVGFALWTGIAGAGATAAAPVLVAPLAAYAAYHAAGAWVFPIVAEMRKINRKRRENGEMPLPFKQRLKLAWKNKTSTRKDKRTYIISGAVNTAVAIAGFAILKNVIEASDAARALTDGVNLNATIAENIAHTRHTITLGKMWTASAAQGIDAGIAETAALLDPDNKEKHEEAKQTLAAAAIGLGINSIFHFSGIGAGHKTDLETLTNLTDSTEHASQAADSLASAAAAHMQDADSAAKTSWLASIMTKFGYNHNSGTEMVDSLSNPSGTGMAAHGTDSLAGGNPGAHNIDSLASASAESHSGSAQAVSAASAENIAESGLFPTQYSPEMGISEKQFNLLLATTEGTLKSASGEEVTLDRAYMNLDNAMQFFEGKTKEEVIYKFNRLYAFMRKAYEVGDGVFRETPAGHDYLESRFSNLGFESDKLTTLIDFAQSNTYAGKEHLVEGLNKLFPDGMDGKTLESVITTIHSNQRFHQHTEEMEALIKLLGCGKDISVEQGKLLNNLLDHTDDLLAGGTRKVNLTGLNLAEGCSGKDMGQWQGQIAEVVPPKAEPVVVPLINKNLEIIPNKTKIQVDFDFNEKVDPVPLIETPAPEITPPEPEIIPPAPETPKGNHVRKVITDNYNDLVSGGGKKQKIFDEERSARLLKRFGRSK